ncbi:MAG: hypothetical protein MUQ75_00245 [Crocinitomicaceae bacterium]|nr:hypothetical protein [Crocinitomicaceae bacterium]
MAHDEFNSGARHGFSMALYAVRNVDRNMEHPTLELYSNNKEETQIKWNKRKLKYDIQKDMLYKIYAEIKKEMKEEVHENDF